MWLLQEYSVPLTYILVCLVIGVFMFPCRKVVVVVKTAVGVTEEAVARARAVETLTCGFLQ